MNELDSNGLIWVSESGVFPPSHRARIRGATAASGHRLVDWDDAFWTEGLPDLTGSVVFHGSLGNAHRLQHESTWSPGAFCDTEAFRCSAWYPRAAPWLLHRRFEVLPLEALVEDPLSAFERVGAGPHAFFRPDSPLKPFSGRVLGLEAVSLAAFDHGFYFDDASLPVVIAPLCTVQQEWRFVVVDRRVVAGSGYIANGRRPIAQAPQTPAWAYASDIAAELEPPEPVYVLDVCDTPDGMRLLELNPFSGADLYACDLEAVVDAIATLLEGDRP